MTDPWTENERLRANLLEVSRNADERVKTAERTGYARGHEHGMADADEAIAKVCAERDAYRAAFEAFRAHDVALVVGEPAEVRAPLVARCREATDALRALGWSPEPRATP